MGNIWTFFIHNKAVTLLITIGIITMGVLSATTLPREVQPEITIPYAAVQTALPGGNPKDIETLITIPLEKEIGTVKSIKTLSSTSSLGMSSIMIEFKTGIDIDKAITELKDKVSMVKGKLPKDATDPMVVKAETNQISIVNFSVIGNRDLSELSLIAEDIKSEIEKVPDVSKVTIVGETENEILITVDQKKAEHFGLGLEFIAAKIKAENFSIPAGIVSIDKLNYSIRTDGRFKDVNDIRTINLITLPDELETSIYLNDIATIELNSQKQPVISKLSIEGEKSLSTITLQVFKKDGSNAIKVVDTAKEKIEVIKSSLPQDIKIAVSNDMSLFIRQDLGILTTNGIQTTIIIILILFLALGIKEGLIAGISIPITLLASLAVMDIAGLTINSLTLFSLVIALGLMVDTAIVIMEGIHENLQKGFDAKTSAINSVQTYKWPLIAGTFTTIFAFFPMLLVSGMVGEFLKSLPITISAALLSSLFISLAIVPTFAASLLAKKNMNGKKTILYSFFKWAGEMFEGLIQKILKKKSLRRFTIIISIILFIASLSLPITGALKIEMFPKTDMRYFIIDIEAKQGLVQSETKKIVEEVESKLYPVPEIESFLTIIGTGQSQLQTDIVEFSSSAKSHLANITVNLVEEKARNDKSYIIAGKIREDLKQITSAKITVRELTEGPPSGSPITVSITGKDLEQLKSIAREIKTIVENVEGTQNTETTIIPGLAEFRFELDREKLSIYGLSGAEVSSKIRTLIQGINLTDTFIGSDEINVRLKYNIKEIDQTPTISLDTIKNVEIKTLKGDAVKLGDIANFHFEEGISSINREEQKRVIKVTSDVIANTNTVETTKKIQDIIENKNFPKGYEIGYTGDTESVNESFNDLYKSMIYGLMLIAATLVLMFNSLKQPFIIILTLPLALIGVFPGLAIIGQNLSFPAFLGVVALSGVVVNDAIVLIDRINQNRKRKELSFTHCICEAANARLQPIIMTSITTIAGILPLALANEFWAGLGFSLIFGLAFSTILTLIVIPVIYFAFERKQAIKDGLSI